MLNLGRDEAADLKGMIEKLNHQACKEILFGMVDLLLYKPSILTKIFRMYIEDGVKFSIFNEKR